MPANISFGCETTKRKDQPGRQWYSPPVLAEKTEIAPILPETRTTAVDREMGDPLCGQSA